ncbi:nuclear transport factor 2 family protein [uncultured Winogradskyella sp.]|uniref:nuclear transport factor 2 family protein n=1 Tax=uncultured Winogradskyella sp. TaxID=395353 RepID=UPI00260F802C|nr:nuclear transport factor 2 family protein [uncultured Winogradskyella sp.]
MKTVLFIISFLICLNLNAQNQEEAQVKATIIEFFDAFHKQDTVKLKAMAKDDIVLQSIAVNIDGKTILKSTHYNEFVTSIASIPKSSAFEEKLLGFNIKVDGKMANAWIPYEFWFNGNFSHCGVNSFQFIKEEATWKILYLVDTRRRDGCQ